MHIDIDMIRTVVIENVIEETPSIKTMIFKDHLSYNAKPGQFLMVWIPRVEELPMSVMFSNKVGYAAVTIRKHGTGSTALFYKKSNDVIGIRGPYGNSFTLSKKYKNVLLIGGGTGLVPIIKFANFLTNSQVKFTLIIGAKTKNEILFYELAKKLVSKTRNKVIVTTEDDTFGIKGRVTDAIKSVIDGEKFDCIYTCGPEMMMKSIFITSLDHSISFQASLERYMKCGIGICASCCIGDKLVCTDGTIFNEKQLRVMPEFGNFFRDKSGRKYRY